MILYTEQQFEAVYNIDRKARMRLGIPDHYDAAV